MHGYSIQKNSLQMRLKREWVAGFFILLISWCTYEGYEGLFFYKIPFYVKHSINFSLLIAVAFLGYYVWAHDLRKWPKEVWVIVYLVVIVLMATIGLLDLFFKFRIGNFREMIHNLRMFFTSPVPYGVLLFLVKRDDGNKKHFEK